MLLKFPGFILLFTVLFFQQSSDAALLGIDFGTDFVKVAVVSQGHSFDIALDTSSKRKVKNLVGFDEGERRFGNEGAGLEQRKPTETFRNFGRLLGKDIDCPIIKEFQDQRYPYKFVKDEKRNTVKVQFGEDILYSMEEIVAMTLQYAKNMAAIYIENEIRDCVLTCPDFFSTKERQALIDAATLSGLNVLGLINENSAAALYYGIEKDYEVGKKENILIYNVGSTSTKVSLVQYSAWEKQISKKKSKTIGQVEILSQAWDESLGGNAWDLAILNRLVELAEKSLGISLEGNYRALARLKKSAEKTKRILSANKDATVRITSLVDDEDFQAVVTRDLFHGLSSNLFKRAITPLDVTLERAGVDKFDVDGIVLMGGGTRIPKLQDLLVNYLDQKELKKDLNTDESAALGAVFRAANMSTTFRVRQIGLIDRILYGVSTSIMNFGDWKKIQDGKMSADEIEFAKRARVFDTNSILKRRKSVSLYHDKDLFVSIFYSDPEDLPVGTKAPIQTYHISGIAKAVAKFTDKISKDEKPKIVIAYAYDASGIASVLRASATFVIKEDGKADKKEKVSLKVESLGSDINSLTEVGKKKSISILKKLDEKDDLIRATAQAFNDVEAYILTYRTPIADEHEFILKVSEESEREEILTILTETEDWLYELENPTLEILQNKYKELKEKVDPINIRAHELKNRKSGIQTIRDEIKGLYTSLADMKYTKSWIPEDEIDALKAKIENWEGWLKENVKKQKKQSTKEQPLFLIEDLDKLVGDFAAEVRTLGKRAEPQIKDKKKKEGKKKKEQEKESTDDSSEADESETSSEDASDEDDEEKARDEEDEEKLEL